MHHLPDQDPATLCANMQVNFNPGKRAGGYFSMPIAMETACILNKNLNEVYGWLQQPNLD